MSAITLLAATSTLVVACAAGDASSEDGKTTSAALSTTASVNGANIPAVGQLVDAAGKTWTLSAGVVYLDGSKAGYTADVIELLLLDGVVYQENISQRWWKWNGQTWPNVAGDPRTTSKNDTSATGTATIVDAAHDVWALSGGVVYENGKKAGYTANAIALDYADGIVFHENSSKGWWSWNGSSWLSANNPTTTPAPPPTTTTSPPSPPPPSGGIWVYRDGKFNWPTSNDYSYALTDNYADASGSPLSGPFDIKVNASPYGGWQPAAGLPLTPNNWDQDITGMKHFTFALKPTASGQTWKLFFHKVGDVYVYDANGDAETVIVNTASYGPVNPPANQWSSYTIPLADVLTDYSAGGVPGKGPATLLTHIYKFAIADATGENRSWYIDNVGFVP